VTALLVIVALGFAFSMGAHYTGACMGMPHALRTVSAWQALLIMAPLTLIGATFASHEVAHTVGHDLVHHTLSVDAEVIVISVAFLLTSAFNWLRVPTSTIQILVFTVAGVALAGHAGVAWGTIGTLAIIWVAAPFVACGLGFALTRALDRVPAVRTEVRREQRAPVGAMARPIGDTASGETPELASSRGEATRLSDVEAVTSRDWNAATMVALALVAVGGAASFTMGANDVANATGSLVGTHTFSPLMAGFVGGLGLAVGVLTWGKPLLNRVAFEIVTVDRPMATAAQLVQALVVLSAVAFGFFTSMNQALVGAMAGAGLARGRQTVHMRTLTGIFRGWIVGPAAGIALGFVIAWLVHSGGVRMH
jgi:PiT family inorganic phosphate transporter